MITIPIRVNHLIELLNKIALENLDYDLWPVHYGDDWYKEVKEITKELNKLYEHKDADYEISIDFNFRAAQILKKMILHFIERNYTNLDKETMHTIINVLLIIDERIEADLIESLTQSIPMVRTNKNAR